MYRALRILPALLAVAAPLVAAAQDATEPFEATLDARTAVATVDRLRRTAGVADAGIDDAGDVWIEPIRTRSREALGRLFLRQTPEGREALRAWMAGGRAPALTDSEVLLIEATSGRGSVGSVQDLFGWDAKAVATFEEGSQAWADKVLPGDTAEPYDPIGGGPSDIDAQDFVYRYACCEGVQVREHASHDAAVVDTLHRGELVTVDRLVAPGLTQLAETIEGCIVENDCPSVAQLLEGLNLSVHAEIRAVHAHQKAGWVPLPALFKTPRVATTDRLRFQVGYNRVVNGLAAMTDALFWPDDCGVATRIEGVTQGIFADNDHYWDYDDQTLRTCSSAWNLPSASGHDVCHTCRPLADAIFGEGALFDADALAGHDLEGAYAEQCAEYLAPSEEKPVLRDDAYQCGEYPFGDTHYGATLRAHTKRVVEGEFWNRTHRVTMGRQLQQTGISFDQWDLASGGVAHFQLGGLVGARNLWFSLMPIHEPDMPGGQIQAQDYEPSNDHALLVHACGRLPGLHIDGPNVDYHWKDTWGDMFNKIDFGEFSFDRLDFCALAKLSLSEDLTPSLAFTEVTDFHLVGADVSGIKITFAAWVYIVAAPVLGAVAVLGGHIGSIVATLVSHLVVALPLYLQISDDESWVVEDLLPESVKVLITDHVLSTLNNATAGTLTGLTTQATGRLATLCDEVAPAQPTSHPLHYFYAYLHAECEALVEQGKWVPFAPHAASAQQGCYGTERFFSPAIDGETDDHAFSQFAGQDWYTGQDDDQGCRLEFQRLAKVDQRLWTTLQCLTATVNQRFNEGEAPPAHWNGFMQQASQACGQPAVEALMDLYGDGSDLLPLLPEAGALGWL